MNPYKRPLVAGDAGVAGGVNWRIVDGRKMPGDLVIQWYVGDRWIPVSMDALFVAVDAMCQNEDVLYPYPAQGGQMLIRALATARLYGYEYASGWLATQRKNRERTHSQDWTRS